MGQGTGRLLDRGHRLTTTGLLMLVTFIAFEALAVGTAMPTAVAQLDGPAWYAWPFSAFLVASGALSLPVAVLASIAVLTLLAPAGARIAGRATVPAAGPSAPMGASTLSTS